jgi:membrane protease YdiL (CAAX protease family)
MSTHGWVWSSPPGWPQPPPGWVPPAGWRAPSEWPQPPADWVYWVPADPARSGPHQAAEPSAPQDLPPQAAPQFAPPQVAPLPYAPPPGGLPGSPWPAYAQPAPNRPPPLPRVEGPERRSLVLETWFVMLAFLAPAVLDAVGQLAAHVGGAPGLDPFSSLIPGHPLANMIFGMVTYLQVGAIVPLALLLLSRTGQGLAVIGFTKPGWRTDLWPGLGLAASGFGVEFVAGIVLVDSLAAAIGRHTALSLFNQVKIGHVPAYYVVYGLTIAATTAIAEEVLVNGYLLTRLEQLGWNPRWAFVLSLTLRTSYHVYYGLGFLLTIPLGYFVTRSFQKHRRLMRPIVAHFIYDAALFTVSVLVS